MGNAVSAETLPQSIAEPNAFSQVAESVTAASDPFLDSRGEQRGLTRFALINWRILRLSEKVSASTNI